tara:strand:- start:38 stop:196 length:159 start_codon:yes stop_codon:yes gene_type:complete
MFIGETLGKSIQEVMQLSVLEIQTWQAYFELKQKESKKKYGNNTPRHRSPRS